MSTPSEELRTKAEAATTGPWDYFVGNADGRGLVRVETGNDAPVAGVHMLSMVRGKQSEADAAYIVAAQPQTIIALLDRIAELEDCLVPFAALLERIPMAADQVEIASINGDLCEKYVDECLSLTIGDFRRARRTLSRAQS